MKNYFRKAVFFILIAICFIRCDYSKGTLGSSQDINFPLSTNLLEKGVSNFLLKNPEYKMPEKWQDLDDWDKRGLGFLNGKIVYFKNLPEEMYYITISDDIINSEKNHTTAINIRAVNRGWSWINYAEISETEKKRIEKRFLNEVILKMEESMNIKSKRSPICP